MFEPWKDRVRKTLGGSFVNLREWFWILAGGVRVHLVARAPLQCPDEKLAVGDALSYAAVKWGASSSQVAPELELKSQVTLCSRTAAVSSSRAELVSARLP